MIGDVRRSSSNLFLAILLAPREQRFSLREFGNIAADFTVRFALAMTGVGTLYAEEVVHGFP